MCRSGRNQIDGLTLRAGGKSGPRLRLRSMQKFGRFSELCFVSRMREFRAKGLYETVLRILDKYAKMRHTVVYEGRTDETILPSRNSGSACSQSRK